MKSQLNSTLIDIIRKPRTHRITESVWGKLLVFAGIFCLMQLAETLVLAPFIWDSLISTFSDITHATQGGTLNRSQVVDELNAILTHPEVFRILLFSTIAGTLTVLFWVRYFEGRKLRTMGFLKQGAVKHYLMGLVEGFVTFSLIVGLSFLFGGVQFDGFKGQFSGMLLLTFIGFLFQGMNEEVLFRGYMMTSTLRHHNLWWAVGINSVLFGITHGLNKGFTLYVLFNLILYAAVMSLYVLRTGNLWGACAFHSVWNFAEGSFFGLPVSGVNVGDTIFAMSLKGSKLVNGGAFGLEAGIATTIVMGIWMALLLFAPHPLQKTSAEEEKTA